MRPTTPAEEFAARQRRHAELSAEIAALGHAAAAPHAANALLIYGNAPNYGLDTVEDRLLASQIRDAIRAYQAAAALQADAAERSQHITQSHTKAA